MCSAVVPTDAVERAVDRLERVLARVVRARLQVGLVDLDDVGAGGHELAQLLVDRDGVVQRQPRIVGIVVVLRLLAIVNGPGHGDRGSAGRAARAGSATSRTLDRDACAESGPTTRGTGFGWPSGRAPSRVVEVEPLERVGEAVRVALAPDLAVGDDVDAGVLHVADREQRRVVLRLLEPARVDAPELDGRRRAAAAVPRASHDRSASRAADSCRRRWSGAEAP